MNIATMGPIYTALMDEISSKRFLYTQFQLGGFDVDRRHELGNQYEQFHDQSMPLTHDQSAPDSIRQPFMKKLLWSYILNLSSG